MKIEYDSKSNKFLMTPGFGENGLVVGMPERRFRKGTGVWAVPALKQNIVYMEQHLNNPRMYSEEALAAFNVRRQKIAMAEPEAKVPGTHLFPAWFKFKNKPMNHQQQALEKFFPLDEAAILFEQGLGKTFTAINLACAWRMTDKIDSVIVICPSSIKQVWEEEIAKHSPLPYQSHVLESGKYTKAVGFLEKRSDFQWMVVGVESFSQGDAIEYATRYMLGRRCMMIIDESSRIKTPNKIRTDRCIKLGELAKKRVILSGTALTQGLEDFYTQFAFLNKDIIGYNSYYSFRAQYCVLRSIPISATRSISTIVGYKNEAEFIQLVAPYSMRVEKTILPDMPEKVYTTRYVTMNPTQKRLYNEMKHELYNEINGVEYEVSTVLEQMLRLQQITGGHYARDDGEKVVPTPIPGKNPKIQELMSVLDEVSGKVIVWVQFRSEVDLIVDALHKAKVQYVQFHGGCDEGEKRFAVQNFRADPATKVFVATRAAAYGLTLTEASTAVYFSQSYSLEEYSQNQDRIHRIGQKEVCNYIHLTCDKTIDTKVIKALQDKKAVADLIYDLLKENN
tara:strand:+ start:6966 stop:8657 length:1692 start_codon:yes stop_codon:yes gene_type:complete